MFKFVTVLVLWAIVLDLSVQDAIKEFVKGNQQLTAKIFKEINTLGIDEIKGEIGEGKSGNLVVSPFSAETVLSLTAEGAKGPTANELISGLNLPKSTEDRHAAFTSILAGLTKSTGTFQLLFANRIYIAQCFEIKESFEKIATSIYQSDIKNVNFKNNNQAAKLINNWVESKTNNKIQDLISPDGLNADTVLVLVNTLYLNGKWVTPFDSRRTSKESFRLSDGNTELVDTMHSKDFAQYRYFHCGYLRTKFLEIPFNDSHVSMTFILPDNADSFSYVEDNLEDYLTPHNFKTERVYVAIPRFSVSTTIDFDVILKKLGITRVFNPSQADLSGISDEKKLHVDSVIQKAFINVTEIGTEAAAATAVTVSTTSIVSRPPLTFIANRSFVYYIRDDDSGTILFVGRFTNGH